jgi:hypothetical protein
MAYWTSLMLKVMRWDACGHSGKEYSPREDLASKKVPRGVLV